MYQVSPYRAEFEPLAESRSRRAASFLPESDLLFARQIQSGLSDSLSKVDLYQRVSRSGNFPVQIVIRSDLASPLSFSNGLFGFLFQGRFVPKSIRYSPVWQLSSTNFRLQRFGKVLLGNSKIVKGLSALLSRVHLYQKGFFGTPT